MKNTNARFWRCKTRRTGDFFDVLQMSGALERGRSGDQSPVCVRLRLYMSVMFLVVRLTEDTSTTVFNNISELRSKDHTSNMYCKQIRTFIFVFGLIVLLHMSKIRYVRARRRWWLLQRWANEWELLGDDRRPETALRKTASIVENHSIKIYYNGALS